MSKTIFVFPGQGAQYVGMGKALSESFVPAKQLLEKADDTLGFSISKVMFEGPEEDLKITANTQPALFVSSMMVLEVLKSEGVDFDFVAGHSLGEYSAICAAGGFSFEDGLKLVRLRGSLMAKAGQEHPGSMAAIIGVDDDKIQELCDAVKNVGIVVPANFNCPGQIVVSGEVDAVKALVDNCGAAGVKAVPLAVSGAFHSPLMQPAKEELEGMYSDVLDLFFSMDFFLEVVPKNVGKDSSLDELLKIIGIQREELVACGDGMNDISMIKYAGLGVAMENAYPEVKEVADVIAPSNDDNGVAYVLEKYF